VVAVISRAVTDQTVAVYMRIAELVINRSSIRGGGEMRKIIRYSFLVFMVLSLFAVEGVFLAAAGIFFPDLTFLGIVFVTGLTFFFGYALGLN
jgi:hypothetical protein